MRSIRYAAFWLLFATLNVSAEVESSPFFDPFIEPTNPTSADNIQWIALWDGCGALGTPTISRSGEQIDVRWPVERFCFIPLGGHALLDLGQFPEGTYTVHVVPCDIGWGSFPNDCYVLPSPEDVPFAVAGFVPASSVPSLGRSGSLVLASLLILVTVARRPDARIVAGVLRSATRA